MKCSKPLQHFCGSAEQISTAFSEPGENFDRREGVKGKCATRRAQFAFKRKGKCFDRPQKEHKKQATRWRDPSQVVLALGRGHSVGAAAVGRVVAASASLQARSVCDRLPVGAAAVLEGVARTFAALPGRRRVVVGAASLRHKSATAPLALGSASCGLQGTA